MAIWHKYCCTNLIVDSITNGCLCFVGAQVMFSIGNDGLTTCCTFFFIIYVFFWEKKSGSLAFVSIRLFNCDRPSPLQYDIYLNFFFSRGALPSYIFRNMMIPVYSNSFWQSVKISSSDSMWQKRLKILHVLGYDTRKGPSIICVLFESWTSFKFRWVKIRGHSKWRTNISAHPKKFFFFSFTFEPTGWMEFVGLLWIRHPGNQVTIKVGLGLIASYSSIRCVRHCI